MIEFIPDAAQPSGPPRTACPLQLDALPVIEYDLDSYVVCGVPVREGAVPEHLGEVRAHSDIMEANDKQALIKLGAGRILVEIAEDDLRVTAHPAQGRRLLDLTFAMYSWIPSVIAMFRGFYFMHATALTKDGVTIAITGRRRAGKSTTAVNLIAQGWSLCGDDTTPVAFLGDEAWVAPYSRPIHLEPTLAQMVPGAVELAIRLPRDTKRAFRAEQDLTPRRLDAVVQLVRNERKSVLGEALTVRELGVVEAVPYMRPAIHVNAAAFTPSRGDAAMMWMRRLAAVTNVLVTRPAAANSHFEVTEAIQDFLR